MLLFQLVDILFINGMFKNIAEIDNIQLWSFLRANKYSLWIPTSDAIAVLLIYASSLSTATFISQSLQLLELFDTESPSNTFLGSQLQGVILS